MNKFRRLIISPKKNSGQKRQFEPVFNIPGVIVAFISLCITVFVAQTCFLNENQNIWFMVNLGFWPVRFSQGTGFEDPFAFLTAISYSFLHGGVSHIIVNMVWLAAFGSPLAGRIGTMRIILFWGMTALAAAFTHYAIYWDSTTPLIGASGSISGMMGAAARFGFRRVPDSIGNDRRSAFSGPLLPIRTTLMLRPVLTFLSVWFVVNLITGLVSLVPNQSAAIAWEAHIGGFIAGFFGIAWFDRPHPLDHLVVLESDLRQ